MQGGITMTERVIGIRDEVDGMLNQLSARPDAYDVLRLLSGVLQRLLDARTFEAAVLLMEFATKVELEKES